MLHISSPRSFGVDTRDPDLAVGRGRSLHGRRVALLLLSALTIGSAAVSSVRASPPSVSTREQDAKRVLAEVQELDARFERSVEAFNLARLRLEATRRRLVANGRELVVARRNLARARSIVAERLVHHYTADGPASLVEILLGAGSVGDAMDRYDLERRVAAADRQVLREVKGFRAEVGRRRVRLRRARAEQDRLVAELGARRSSIEAELGKRRRLLSSIEAEIDRLQAAERARQARTRREVEARLAEERPVVAPPAVGVTVELPGGIAVAPPSRHGHVVAIAMRYLGIPYLWGGASPGTGFDCSGFVLYVYAQVGISLPHNAALQYGYGIPVARDELEPGDLVFFNNLGHDGIYIGNGQFIQSPRTGDVVKISSLSEPWYASTYVGARRLP